MIDWFKHFINGDPVVAIGNTPIDVNIIATDTTTDPPQDLDVTVEGDPVVITGALGIPIPQRDDGSLVVDDISLNNALGNRRLTNNDRLMVETRNIDVSAVQVLWLGTIGQELGLNVQGMAGASVVLDGTWTGTITFEASANGGGRYDPINGQAINGVVALSTTTAAGTFRFNVTGLDRLRVRCTAAMTGAARVTFKLSSASYDNLIASTVVTAISAGSTSIGAVTEATLDPTVVPIAKTWPIAPTAPAVQTTYTSTFLGAFPQLQPRVRTQAAGSELLPFKQKEITNEIMIYDEESYRRLERLIDAVKFLAQSFAKANNIDLPSGWEEIH